MPNPIGKVFGGKNDGFRTQLKANVGWSYDDLDLIFGPEVALSSVPEVPIFLFELFLVGG